MRLSKTHVDMLADLVGRKVVGVDLPGEFEGRTFAHSNAGWGAISHVYIDTNGVDTVQVVWVKEYLENGQYYHAEARTYHRGYWENLELLPEGFIEDLIGARIEYRFYGATQDGMAEAEWYAGTVVAIKFRTNGDPWIINFKLDRVPNVVHATYASHLTIADARNARVRFLVE